MVAALTATIIAPVKAGPVPEPLLSAANATLPTVTLPDLLDPHHEAVRTAPEPPDSEILPDTASNAAPAARPSGDLASMVADLRAPEAGSRELECLATGLYFHSHSQPTPR